MHGDDFTRIPVEGESEADARFISVVRAAVLLGEITTREVRYMIRRGQLETIKSGRRRLILVASLNAYLNERIKESRAAVAA